MKVDHNSANPNVSVQSGGFSSFPSQIEPQSLANFGTDFSMPGEVEDGYSAAMAGIAALEMDSDNFGAAPSQDSLIGMFEPTLVQPHSSNYMYNLR